MRPPLTRAPTSKIARSLSISLPHYFAVLLYHHHHHQSSLKSRNPPLSQQQQQAHQMAPSRSDTRQTAPSRLAMLPGSDESKLAWLRLWAQPVNHGRKPGDRTAHKERNGTRDGNGEGERGGVWREGREGSAKAYKWQRREWQMQADASKRGEGKGMG